MTSKFYDSDRALAEYLLFHYGPDDAVLPWPRGPKDALHFPVRCVSECLIVNRLPPKATALDVGCAVGGASFELARHCSSVLAVDLSSTFIAAARQLQESGEIDFPMLVEGKISVRATARLPKDVDPRRVVFETGDALGIQPSRGPFDVVLAANLLDRVPDPRGLLAHFERLVADGGQLILTSPYTWLEEHTPPLNWLTSGGRRTSELLAELLPAFVMARRLDLPFLIREHARKFQWSVAEATVWIHKSPQNNLP